MIAEFVRTGNDTSSSVSAEVNFVASHIQNRTL